MSENILPDHSLTEQPLSEHHSPSMDKTDFSAEDGLDQEIQRAIAQHDLEQRQLQQQNDPAAHAVSEAEHQLAPVDGLSLAQHDKQQQQGLHEALEKATMPEHGEQVGLDAADEKLHLQMIANELKRATTTEPKPEATDSQIHDHLPLAASLAAPEDDAVRSLANARYIPPDSELLATNTAVAAYNALSSQVPPVVLLANVHLAALPMPIVSPDYLPARIQLLINTLPVLDNLASQLLRVFAVGPCQKIIDLATNSETPTGAVFRDLNSIFEFIKGLYSEGDPFLTVEHLAPGMWKEGDKTPTMFRSREQSIESTLRKVNLATFLAATVGTINLGFFYLNESFLDVFCPVNNLEPENSMSNMSFSNTNLQSGANTIIGDKVGKILKPQASLYLELKTQAFISAVEAGERSREEILEDLFPSNMEEVLMERRGVKTLSPTEVDFVNRCKSRRDILLTYPEDAVLSEEYEWFTFVRDLFDFVSKNMSFLIWGKKTKAGPLRLERPSTASEHAPHSDEILRAAATPPVLPENGVLETASNQEINEITSALLPSEIQEQQIHLRINPRMQGKANRRPWTREEEKALRHALELKGPQWSTILELFGQGGRINEALRNRTQVQLKDKARNWKMFFLKSGLPVPQYLLKVTGDLERDDKLRAKNARNRKTAAAPVPSVAKKDNASADFAESEKKRQKAN